MQYGALTRAVPKPISHIAREATAFARVAVAAIWGFLMSRRWLVSAVLVTVALLAVLLTLGRPKQVVILAAPEAVEAKFDEVTNLGTASGGSWFHRWTAEASNNVEKSVPGLTLGTPPDDDSEPPESTRLTRRLDAVRSRQSKGAILTGTIDTQKFRTDKLDVANARPRQFSNAPLRRPARVQLPQTADSSRTAATPDSVFR